MTNKKCEKVMSWKHLEGKNVKVMCTEPGTLRSDTEQMFSGAKVLCEEHYQQELTFINAPCGICGSSRKRCCC